MCFVMKFNFTLKIITTMIYDVFCDIVQVKKISMMMYDVFCDKVKVKKLPRWCMCFVMRSNFTLKIITRMIYDVFCDSV